MKTKTRQRVAKWFAIFVVIVMMFQVLLPLFSSTYMNTSANADTSAVATESASTTGTSLTIDELSALVPPSTPVTPSN